MAGSQLCDQTVPITAFGTTVPLNEFMESYFG